MENALLVECPGECRRYTTPVVVLLRVRGCDDILICIGRQFKCGGASFAVFFLLMSGYVKGMSGRGIDYSLIVVYVMNECGE